MLFNTQGNKVWLLSPMGDGVPTSDRWGGFTLWHNLRVEGCPPQEGSQDSSASEQLRQKLQEELKKEKAMTW